MANQEQIARLRRSVAEWNEWRQDNPQLPDLRGADLRGCDLAGANLRGADIRGARFEKRRVNQQWHVTNLTGADLTGAQAGLLRRGLIGQLLLVFVIAGLSGLLSSFGGLLIYAIIFNSDFSFVEQFVVGISLALCWIATYVAIGRQGFTFQALNTILGAVAVAVAGAVAVAFAGAVAGAFAVAFAGAVAFAVAGAVAGAFAVAVAVASLALGIYAARRANRGDPKFAVLRQLSLSLATLGGTNFWGANLTEARFKDATLESANFTETTLTRTQFTGAQKLDQAKPGNTYLANFPLLQLLTDPNSGYQADLSNLDLRGVYLANANLSQAKLIRSDLADADLSGAELPHANLREANCIGTNFSKAHLTGACLEGWNIDNKTTFDNVDCQYVFRLECANANGSRERRPHHPDKTFQPGDFEKLFGQAANLVELLIRNGLDRDAFGATFQELMDKFGVTPADVQSIEKKGDDVLVTVQVPEETDKADFEQCFELAYAEKLAQLTADRDAARLEASTQKQRADTLATMQNSLLQILSNFSEHPATVYVDSKSQATSQTEKRDIHSKTYREANLHDRAQLAENDILNTPDAPADAPADER